MTTTSENKNTVTSWRVRDAADNLLARRGLRSTSLFESLVSSSPGITTTNNDEVTCNMTLSKYFLKGLVTYSEIDPSSSNTVQECQARLRGDKTSVVHMAFNAAANAVLENLHKADDDDDNNDNDEELQEKRQRLPSIFEDIIRLQEIRTASMDRAHANKDLSKRKIAVAKEQEEERLQKPKLPPPLVVVKEQQRQQPPKLKLKSKPVGDGEKKKLNNPIPTISQPENIKSPAAVAAEVAVVVASSSSNPTDDQKQQDLVIKQPKEEEEIPIKQEQHNKEPILADPDLVSSSSVTTTTATTTSSSSVGPVAVKDDTTKNLIQTTATDNKSNENDVIPPKVASSTTIDTTTSTSSSSNTGKLPSLTSTSSLSSEVNNNSSTTPTNTPTAAPKFKFTRNTPASSTSALEARLTGSRAVLCTTANVAFDSLTPPLPELDVLEVADIPQNPNFRSSNNNQLLHNGDGNDGNDAVNKVEHVNVRTERSNDSIIEQDGGDKTTSSSAVVPNMGAVIIEAKALGQRIETIAANAVKRSQRRFRFRKDSIVFHNKSFLCNNLSNTNDSGFRILENPFAWKDEKQEHEKNGGKVLNDDDGANDGDSMGVSAMEVDDSLSVVTAENIPLENSESWEKSCIPRLLSILKTGVGNGIIYDAMWSTRHGRIANLFQEISCNEENYGLHLIVTIDPDVDRFTKEFKTINSHLRLMSTADEKSLRAMPYKGNAEQRRRLRTKFTQATGLSDAPFHVIVSSYTNFLKDYIHFCQTPFEVVLMDDGASIMAAAHNDPNSAIHTIWEDALFSKSDHQMGLAGSFLRDWDYEEDEFDEDTLKDVWIGLTARHRLITSSKLLIQNPKTLTQDMLPVSGLLNFVVPHFAEAVREEWDRSRIGNDDASMRHFQKLLTRSLVVHAPKVDDQSVFKLAMKTLQGDMEDPIRSKDPKIPKNIADEKFIIDGKVASSRRSALHWLGPVEDSWLRYELGSANFGPIITAMKASINFGHICEEIVTASSVTTGATGQIFGNVAYKLAVRCGRSFGSEQGLRQHLSTHHAPPGTWLCRTCKADCVTSQARTHHERSCGQPSVGSWSATDVAVAASDGASKRGVGKKKVKTSKGDAVSKEEKDADGSIRVPSYRGVWVDQIGKFFVKIKADRVCGEGGGTLKFEKIDVAAKKYDDLLKKKDKDEKAEFNFKSDGTRIIYEDVSTSSTASLGGGSASVIPALSVININDLPKDVKPLLRDPRQTSRTGGNSKRHVYAYRGVCRQARKGLDRWQSQISFLGVNHYLGTFDSEWDAAAIYAWAHLILYGEAETRKAQKEGEEAAEAYEQEKKDIAAGKIPEPPPKPEKKKKKPRKKKEMEKKDDEKATDQKDQKNNSNKGKVVKIKGKPGRPRKRPITEAPAVKQPATKKLKPTPVKVTIAPILAKSVGKATILAPVPQFEAMHDDELTREAVIRIIAARDANYCITDVPLPAPIHFDFRPCVPLPSKTDQMGGAMLLGINPFLFGWFVNKLYFGSDIERSNATPALTAEFGQDGLNQRFRSLVQGRTTVIGCASSRMKRVYASLGMGSPPLGGPIGTIDCNIGGNSKCCSETAACIRYVPTDTGDFQLSALSSDLITINGQKITPEMGTFPLFNEDICTIGSRVFVFLLPSDT